MAAAITLLPGENLQAPGLHGRGISKNPVWKLQFKIRATPDRRFLNHRQLKCAIDPASTRPARRPAIPVGMIVEGDQCEWLGKISKPERGEMVKIPRSVENKRRQPLPD